MKKLFILFVFMTALTGVALGQAESILVISDTHLTKEAQNHAAAMEAVIQAAQGRDTVLMLGDNTNNTHAEEHALVLQWAQEIREHTEADVYIIPGNHDYSSGIGSEDFSAKYHAYGWDQAFSRDVTTASYGVMTRFGTCLLMLDTNQFDQTHSVLADGGINGNTLKWLQELLEALPDGTPVLACGHHPILPRERNERTPGAYALGLILRAYGVKLYLCGHDHGFATVEQDGLRQITVGQPQAYPGWVGIMEQEKGSFYWHTEQIYDAQSSFFVSLQDNAHSLGQRMARGTLAVTPYADDDAAIEWFASAFMLFASGDMTPEQSALLLADENCQKWREAETRTVVKDWILGLLENNPEDVRQITIPSSQKHPMELESVF